MTIPMSSLTSNHLAQNQKKKRPYPIPGKHFLEEGIVLAPPLMCLLESVQLWTTVLNR